MKLVPKSSRSTQITASTVTAEIQSASGKAAAAIAALNSLIDDCHEAGFVLQEFRTRLALGEAEIRAANRASGRAPQVLGARRHLRFLLIATNAVAVRVR